MNVSAKIDGNIRDKALLTEDEARFYVSMGRTAFREWAKEIGAIRRRGRRVLYNREVIDNYLRMENGGDQNADNQN